MTMPAPPRIFEPRRDGWPAAWLALAMVAVAATEGIGLMLIAPMLLALGATGGAIPAQLSRLHLPTALPALLLVFVGLVVLRALIVHARNMASLRLQQRVIDGLRDRAWTALLRCDWRTLATMRHSRNASLLIHTIDRVGEGVDQMITALATMTTLCAIAAAGLALSTRLTLGIAIAGVLALLAYRGLHRRAMRLGEALGLAYERLFHLVTEAIGALRVIKSFGREDETAARFHADVARLRAGQRSYQRVDDFAQGALQSGGGLLLALVIWLAVDRWGARPAVILPLVALFARALPLLGTLQRSWQGWAHCRPAMDTALALIRAAEAAREPDDPAVAPPRLAEAMTFERVTVHFADRDRPALEEISLTIPALGITALAGASGAGKSTLADLAGGLAGPDRGRVLIDGRELGAAERRAWRSQVAYVQQEPVLFTGTIRSNLAWAEPEADEAALRAALADASADFVATLPEGIDSAVGEGGRQLSGGERQRLALARALLRRPQLLILDEATSALDADNDRAIAGAVARLRGRLTVLIIGHRGALQEIADHVVRLEAGRVVSGDEGPQGRRLAP